MSDLHVDRDRPLVVVSPSGPLTTEVVDSLIRRMIADPAFLPGMPSLWDLSGCDLNEVRAEEVRRIGSVSKKHSSQRGPAKVALLAPKDVAFGVSRMFEAIGAASHLRVQVFRDREKAEEWLFGTDGPP